MPGHWMHDWVPLDAEAALSKFHGKLPAEFSGFKEGPLYHGTSADLKPGDFLHTNYGYAHATTKKAVAASYAMLRGGGHVYEVAPLGHVEKDTHGIVGIGANSSYRSEHGFRVVRKLPESAEDLYFGTSSSSRADARIASWASRWAMRWSAR